MISLNTTGLSAWADATRQASDSQAAQRKGVITRAGWQILSGESSADRGDRTPCVRDVGCGMWDAGCRMQDAGCRMQDAGCGMRDAGCGMQDAGCRMRDAGCGMQDAGC